MSTELNKKTVSLILVGAVSHSLSIVFNVSFSHCVQIKIMPHCIRSDEAEVLMDNGPKSFQISSKKIYAD